MGRAKKVKYSYYTSDPIPPGFGNSVYINTNKEAVYSTDGITFQDGTTFTNGYCIDYSPTLNRWVAGDVNGGRYSDDGGETWTGWTYQPGGTLAIDKIIWVSSKSKFFLVGTDSGVSRTAESSDGITWTTKASSAFTTPFDLAYSESLDMFIVTSSSSGSDQIQYSIDDMASWVTVNTGKSLGSELIYWIDFLGLWFISGYQNANKGVYLTSTDGLTWTERYMGYNGTFMRNLAVGLNEILWVTNRTDGNGCWRSTDAINWVQVFPPNKAIWGMEDPVFNNKNNLYYNFGTSGNLVLEYPAYTSPDGITWTNTGVNSIIIKTLTSRNFGPKRY
jgi:hypothetical protein